MWWLGSPTESGQFWDEESGTPWLAGRDIFDIINTIRKAAARACRLSINSTQVTMGQR